MEPNQELIKSLMQMEHMTPELAEKLEKTYRLNQIIYNNPETSEVQKQLASVTMMEIEDMGQLPTREMLRESLSQFQMYIRK